MTKEELEARVYRCISKKQEGNSWDFKRQWYEGEQGRINLLHDILCMSNLIADEDGIIIIGVDEGNNYSLCDVSSDPNRKNTQMMVTFLRDKPFDGGIRPTVYVETLVISGVVLDVIVVESSTQVPYYLTRDFKNSILPYRIYTRVGDTNTARDKSADRDKVEKLWKKRFGIDKSPLEKFKIYLEDYNHWKSVDGQQSWFYELFPEFRIETEWDEERTSYEYYCFTQISIHKPSWYWMRLKYHNTLIHETLLLSLDGGNFKTVIPSRQEFFAWVPFDYYVAGDINESLHCFYKEKGFWREADNYMFSNWDSVIPTFESEKEAQGFFHWVKEQKYPDINQFKGCYIPDGELDPEEEARYQNQFKQAQMMCNMIEKYRNSELKALEQ